jgi:hypothetical protein
VTAKPGIGLVDDFDAHDELLFQALLRSLSSARQGDRTPVRHPHQDAVGHLGCRAPRLDRQS